MNVKCEVKQNEVDISYTALTHTYLRKSLFTFWGLLPFEMWAYLMVKHQ